MPPENYASEPHRPPDEARRPLRAVPESEDSSPTGSAIYVRDSPGGLPNALTSFVGREREVEEVGRLLSEYRLVTLSGSGGSGKTRLALHAAMELCGEFEDAAWWVALAPLSDPELVGRTVASTLDVHGAPGRSLVETLAEHLEAKEMLLVLDNCEHLIAGCAALVEALLCACPGLRVLATSREPLGVAGEASWPVPPLSLPDPGNRLAEEISRCGSVRLFVARAGAVARDFSLTEENAPEVARLCERLDGMPLAIELAASRIKALSPRQILARLDDRFKLVAEGPRTAPPRHRTLRATMDWSHDLLEHSEKVLFRRLSVFSGGWTLEAAEAVCAGEGIETDDVLDVLALLVDKSLVVASESDGEARYRMLETVRQYGREKLEASGEEPEIRRRHADFLLALVEEAEPGMVGTEQIAWVERLEIEHDDIRAALGWLRGEGEAERGLRLASGLLRFWWFQGHLAEGRAQLEGTLDLCSAAPVRDEVRAGALNALGVLIHRHADYAAGDLDVARSRLEESLAIYRRLGDEERTAAVLQNLGRVGVALSEWTAARSSLDESLTIARRLGNEAAVALSLFYSGMAHLLGRDLSPARSRIEEALGIFRRLDDKFWINASLVHLGYVDCEEGERAAARSRFMEMSEVGPVAQLPWGATYALDGFARLAAAEGKAARALRLGGATAALRETYGVSVDPAGHAAFQRSLEPAWRAIGEERGASAWEEGRAMSLDEAIAFAYEEPETKPESSVGGPLSAREIEVLRLAADGLTDAQVAERLYLSRKTVGHHLSAVYRKLGVRGRAAAVHKADELGLI